VRQCALEMPAPTEQALSAAVARQLETELGRRGLLLAPDALAAVKAEAAQDGARLLHDVMQRCYGAGVQLDYQGGGTAERLAAALAFGAVTARVLATHGQGGELARDAELLCAVFNMGIGLVDGVCDDDPETGGALLELVRRHDLVDASATPRERGWLRGTSTAALAQDHMVAFTADVIETFFETLHGVYPGDEWSERRRLVGAQLEAALDAEHRTVVRPAGDATVAELADCSRLTSVLPFEIIETLAGGRGAGTLLGEAMWRIDDLVDLCEDARSGALNALLLQTSLERVLSSGHVARAAAEAAADLQSALQRAPDRAARSFLFFLQQYTGLAS
jgi:hypothetical protein